MNGLVMLPPAVRTGDRVRRPSMTMCLLASDGKYVYISKSGIVTVPGRRRARISGGYQAA